MTVVLYIFVINFDKNEIMFPKKFTCFDLFFIFYISSFLLFSLVIQSGNTQRNTGICQRCLQLDDKFGFLSFKNQSDDYEYDCDAQFPGRKIRKRKCSICRSFFETASNKQKAVTWAKNGNCDIDCTECCNLQRLHVFCTAINSTHCEYNCHERFQDSPITRVKCLLCDKCLSSCTGSNDGTNIHP